MQSLTSLIYTIIVTLQAPVIIGLLLLLLWTLYMSGGFFREWRLRKTALKSWNPFIEKVSEDVNGSGEMKTLFYEQKQLPTLVCSFRKRSKEIQNDFVNLKRAISEIELEATRTCNHMRIGLRIGPMLGLIGTLIPMGPALKAIATGSLEAMSTNMIVAFSTTVIGLLIAGICYVIYTVRQHWYVKDISDIDYLMETVFAQEEEATENVVAI